MDSVASEPVDLTNCDREPIHLLGAIQPFGFLLVLDSAWSVVHASVNLEAFAGRSWQSMLGRPAAEIFDPETIHILRNMAAMLRGEDAVERAFAVPLYAGGPGFDFALHVSRGLLIVEAEPAAGDRGDATAMVRTMISRVRQVQSMREFLQEAARQVRALTGFDRVMVYRFDAVGSGEVMAEAKRSGVDSFLGLNYPASDIPVQARALYLRNIFRVIADLKATPAPIEPALDGEGRPIDLSMSVLRSVSPIHIEYLLNMGVGASLSISIIVEGRLWGLFACHHYSPRRPNFLERTAAELFGAMFGLMLESRERAAVSDYEAQARLAADRLLSGIARDTDQMADPEWLGSVVADAIPSDGVGVWVDGALSLAGLTPQEAQFHELIGLLNRTASGQIYHTDHIASKIPAAADYASKAAGLLAIPISRAPRDYVLLFRAERLKSVRWAGNPEKPVDYGPNGARLTPRKSFEEWSELVKGHALPFSAAELRVAETMRGALLEVVLRLADAAGEERRKAEERQTLLIAELNHRVRNILALIRGLISQTRQRSEDPETMLRNLDQRVQALARAHEQITADHWAPASLTALIETEASAFLGAKRGQLRIQGGDVKLDPEAFTVMALVVHEMVTNAAKYGALSDNGSVHVDWRRNEAGDLLLAWREVGGPVVTAPTRRGFGSTIIERSVPHDLGGAAEIRHKLGGLEADFTIPARYVVLSSTVAAIEPQPSAPIAGSRQPLEGKVVLLLEDSLMIALECEASLLELGATDVLVASSTEDAKALLAERRADFAVLDYNLGKETSLGVADLLAEQGTPVVFATGYGDALSLPPRHQGAKVILKPYSKGDLRRVAVELLKAD
jgi:light-regulated signal transduction histidine kinase (bacteriophytochrome)